MSEAIGFSEIHFPFQMLFFLSTAGKAGWLNSPMRFVFSLHNRAKSPQSFFLFFRVPLFIKKQLRLSWLFYAWQRRV
jgi:hypothetical protein